MSYLQIQLQSQVGGVKASTCEFLGGPIQPIIQISETGGGGGLKMKEGGRDPKPNQTWSIPCLSQAVLLNPPRLHLQLL